MLQFVYIALTLATAPPIAPPVAKREPQKVTTHGVTRVDDYNWLRQKDTPPVLEYLKLENEYTDALLSKPTEALRTKLYEEMKARLKETDLSVPFWLGGYWYYSRTEAGKEYPIRCRKKGSMDAPEAVFLDLNALRGSSKFLSLGGYDVSVDTKWLAYATDATGFRQYTLQFKDLTSGALLSERIEKVDAFAWAADNKTVFYVTEDAAKRPAKLWRHTVGTDPTKDVAVYEEKDERFSVGIRRTRSDAFLVMELSSLTTSEERVLDAKTPTEEWRVIATRQQDLQYEVDHRGDLFYIRTNDKGRNFRLVTAPVRNPSRVQWTEVIAHRDDVMIEHVDLFKDFYVVFTRKDALPHLTVVTQDKSEEIGFDEAAYSVFESANEAFDASAYRFTFVSFVTPQSVFEYDVKAKTKKLLKQDEVLGGYDPSKYVSERVFATAADGMRVPISLVYKKGLKKDGKAPLILNGYGSYGIPSGAYFDGARFSFIDRGGVFAIAHIRGGGDLGKTWHDQGRMMNKKTTFSDFISCAETLVNQRFTSKAKLGIVGGSAGGLLMGAVVNARPDLFKAVIAQVPFVDVINTMLDETLPLTVTEFEEWGNPKDKAAFDYMMSYSPYDNVAKKAYPSMLVVSAYNDSQVMYFEPAKWVAKLRAMKTDKHPLYLRMNLEPAGHGGRSGRYERLEERAYEYAFFMTELGMPQ